MWTVKTAPDVQPARSTENNAQPVVLAYCCQHCQLNTRCNGIKTTPAADRWSCLCQITERTTEKDKQNKLDYFYNFFITGGKHE